MEALPGPALRMEGGIHRFNVAESLTTHVGITLDGTIVYKCRAAQTRIRPTTRTVFDFLGPDGLPRFSVPQFRAVATRVYNSNSQVRWQWRDRLNRMRISEMSRAVYVSADLIIVTTLISEALDYFIGG